MKIEDYFSRHNIIINLAKYEMYYQITSGNLINTSNTQEINYEIELQYALGSIYEMLKDILPLENFEEILEDELKKQSAMDALQNFVNQNLELVKNSQIQIEPIINNINENTFFNETMTNLCKENEKKQIEKWESIITSELSNAIMTSLLSLEEK
jgi:hypothetical protein